MGCRYVLKPIQAVEKVPSVWLSAGVTALAQVTSPPLDLSLGRRRGGGTFIMMATKERNFSPLKDLSLEDLVPKDNFYRRLERTVDLSFVRELVCPLYARGGRSSVDPVVFFRLQLVMFFEDIRSERRLMEVAADRLRDRKSVV